jgi:hypothetical protein
MMDKVQKPSNFGRKYVHKNLISSTCMIFIVIRKWLNFATFLKNLLASFINGFSEHSSNEPSAYI